MTKKKTSPPSTKPTKKADRFGRLRKRLDPDWLFDHTRIFEHVDPEEAALAKHRFTEYWNTWIKKELNDLFTLNSRKNGL